MTELAKSLQYTTHLVLGLCATLLLFAVPSSRARDRERLTTLQRLNNIDFEQFLGEAFAVAYEKLLPPEVDRVKVTVQRLGARYPDRPGVLQVKPGTSIPLSSRQTRDDTLAKVLSFLNTKDLFRAFIPDENCPAVVEQTLRELQAAYPGREFEFIALLTPTPEATLAVPRFSARRLDQPGVWEEAAGPNHSCTGRVVPIDVIAAVLKRHELTREQVQDAVGVEYPAFTPVGAATLLGNTVTRTPSQLSFMGISAPADDVGRGGLFVVLLAMLYLVAHLRQMEVALRLGHLLESVKTMPWLGFTPEPLGGFLCFVFLFAVPSVTAGVLACLLWSQMGWLAVVGAGFVVGTAVWAFWVALRTRVALRSQGIERAAKSPDWSI